MSEQDNIAVVRRGYEAFQKGDIESLLALLADDIEWETPEVEGIPYGGLQRGKKGVAEFFRQLGESEEILSFEPKEFIAQGEKVVVIGEYRARVRATGQTGESPWIHVMTVRDGKLARFFELYDTAAAQRAHRKAASA